jgi:hypothetical protein
MFLRQATFPSLRRGPEQAWDKLGHGFGEVFNVIGTRLSSTARAFSKQLGPRFRRLPYAGTLL